MSELTHDQFIEWAAQIGVVDPELREDLFPMVRDLLRMARRINSLTPEMHTEIAEGQLSHDARGSA